MWGRNHGTAVLEETRRPSPKTPLRGIMTRQQTLDLYFMEARSKLIDLAAFLDRVDRGTGEPDFRLEAFRQALRCLEGNSPGNGVGR